MNLTTKEYLNNLLNQYGAEVSTNDACLQSKAAGYIGEEFNNTDKKVYDFQIISKTDKKSFANIYSDIYKKIPKEVLSEVTNSYFETNNRIYC